MEFLVEIGTEELPPKSLRKLELAFKETTEKSLKKAELSFSGISSYATPRRLALMIHDLAAKQADRIGERRGPALVAAYNEKKEPTPALIGFARSCQVEIAALELLETPKGSWFIYKENIPGKTVQDLLPDIIAEALKTLPIPKPMRWGNNDYAFIRPVRWCVMLYGETVIPATLFGQNSDRITYGHRFHHPEKMTLATASDYETTLTAGKVIPKFKQREENIAQQVQALAAELHATAIMPENLLEEVAGLVEWPVALVATFKKNYLLVPSEALIAAMQDHQKSFALRDKEGQLIEKFITVSNIESVNPLSVIEGNERVIDARLSDAEFFYETDINHGFATRLDKLKYVTFQKKLGSLYDKSQRVARLAKWIATQIQTDEPLAERAGLLSKCDLITDMVVEFPELQGTMGYYYALQEQEPELVAKALRDYYLPKFAGDNLPQDKVACAVALADRFDTLVGIFGIQQIPTGEKDPYGLRRAAVGIVRILIEKQLSLDLLAVIKETQTGYETSQLDNPDTLTQVQRFILERMRAWYLEQKIPHDIFSAVLARQDQDLYDFSLRLYAVHHFSQQDAAEALASANKRVNKLLLKEDKITASTTLKPDLFQQDAEKELASLIQGKRHRMLPLFKNGEYQQVLNELSELRPAVDRFFDDVTIMVDDENLRNNRLALLAQLRELFLHVADISLLQGAKG